MLLRGLRSRNFRSRKMALLLLLRVLQSHGARDGRRFARTLGCRSHEQRRDRSSASCRLLAVAAVALQY